MIVRLLENSHSFVTCQSKKKENVREKNRSTCLDINHHSSFDVIQNEINKTNVLSETTKKKS